MDLDLRDLRILVVVAFTGLLILLRFDAARFGAAEYDDEAAPGGWRNVVRRFAWYFLGFLLAVAIFRIHPSPGPTLHLGLGSDREVAIAAGIGFGLLGTAAAALFAWWRYRRFRLPNTKLYPGAIANSMGTAIIDEVGFRGALLGLTIAFGWPVDVAIVFQAVIYALATRLGASGRSLAMLGIFGGVGLVGGWLTVVTGGIGAALIGHAITRFAVFLCTGHPGQVYPPGLEPEEEEAERRPPEGWRVVGEPDR